MLERLLPAAERRTALLLVIAGALITTLTEWLTALVVDQAQISVGDTITWGMESLLRGLTEFAFVMIVVLVLIRFARVPRALALYLALASLAAVAFQILGIPANLWADSQMPAGLGSGTTFVQMLVEALAPVATVLGATAGAWVAATVSVERIRNVGLSAEELADRGDHEVARVPSGLWFLGWEGEPIVGDAAIAVAFVAVTIMPSALLAVVGPITSGLVGAQLVDVPGVEYIGFVPFAFSLLLWTYNAIMVYKHMRVHSTWLVPLQAFFFSVFFLVGQAQFMTGADMGMQVLFTLVPALLPSVAVALGVHLAIKFQNATLPGSDA